MRLIWLFIVASLLGGTSNIVLEEPVVTGYIIVGDSRTVGMDMSVDVDDIDANIFVVAKVGKGYHWLVNTAMTEVETIKSENPDINKWTIITNLGVNDLGNCERYVDFYKGIEDEVVVVSVNPVRNYSRVSNGYIDAFNERMREEFDYIDTNTMLRIRGYSTPDGLHYTGDTYRLIFSFIIHELDLA